MRGARTVNGRQLLLTARYVGFGAHTDAREHARRLRATGHWARIITFGLYDVAVYSLLNEAPNEAPEPTPSERVTRADAECDGYAPSTRVRIVPHAPNPALFKVLEVQQADGTWTPPLYPQRGWIRNAAFRKLYTRRASL